MLLLNHVKMLGMPFHSKKLYVLLQYDLGRKNESF